MTKVSINRVWIVTSKKILCGAETSIFSTLEKNNLGKLIRFISREKLAGLIDEKYPAFWDDPLNLLMFSESRKRGFPDSAKTYLVR